MTTVCLTDPAVDSARRLAEQFGLTVAAPPSEAGEYLLTDSDGLSLCCAGERGHAKVDFSEGVIQYRRTKGGGKLTTEAVDHIAQPTVWDATGDLGQNSFVLASPGLNVHAFKQGPAVVCLLSDGLTRALQDDDIRDTARRITLHFGDACTLMSELALQTGRPGVVYLNLMYPERQESATVKKEMAYFHGLVGVSQDETVLLVITRIVTRKRIAVKRPQLGVFLNGEEPAYQYTGKSTWFDACLSSSPVTEK